MANRFLIPARPLLLLLALAPIGCNTNSGTPPPDMTAPEPAAAVVARWLTGRFDSEAQSLADKSYYNVRLTICRVTLDKLAGHTLYVEQAMATTPDQPYRQRVYLVEPRPPEPEHAVSRVFEPPYPTPLVGLCDSPAPRVSLDDLEERAGCAVDLTWKTDHFEGGTTGKDCPSTLNGASYATSQASLHSDKMLSWDRGFTAAGKQVWGATRGPYKFDRKTPLESK